MSTSRIVDIFSRGAVGYLILACGHWVKWTGPNRSPKRDDELSCPTCNLPTLHNANASTGGLDFGK